MTALAAHHTYDDNEPEHIIASVHPASERSVQIVAQASVNDPNGRSQFMWVRLLNGDLILGVYPQGDTYESVEVDASFPHL